MQYEIALADVKRVIPHGSFTTSILFEFRIAHGLSTAYVDVLMSDTAVDAIEQKGKDPETAARVALERRLKDGRNPFVGLIRITIPFGHAAHFANTETMRVCPSSATEVSVAASGMGPEKKPASGRARIVPHTRQIVYHPSVTSWLEGASNCLRRVVQRIRGEAYEHAATRRNNGMQRVSTVVQSVRERQRNLERASGGDLSVLFGRRASR
jgi:hypothetical protein